MSQLDGITQTNKIFVVSAAGVYAQRPNGAIRICARLEIKAWARSQNNDAWALLVCFSDRDGNEHQCLIPMAMLAGDGGEYRALLLGEGLEIEPGREARELLTTYIAKANPPQRIRTVRTTGWYGESFVLPDETVGAPTDEPVWFQATAGRHLQRVCGSAEGWREAIGRFCCGNSRLLFAVGAALAGPLLKVAGERGGGFHFRGPSSSGKTTALQVAGSVWGGGGVNGFVQSWRATTNGLEAVAEGSNDGLLCLDEMSQVDPKEAGDIAYSLANGVGKQRMQGSGAAARSEWDLVFLSSGETSLAEHMRTARRETRTGQEVRLCEIEADAGAGMGLFESLHDFPQASDFARHLADAARNCYGALMRAFLATLTMNRKTAAETVARLRQDFLSRNVPIGAPGEVCRAASRFALVGAAGELATDWGLTGWQPNDSTGAAAKCFASWIKGRVAGGDELRAVEQVLRAFLKLHGATRFGVLGAGFAPASYFRLAGFRAAADGAAYLVLQEVFRDEICKDLDSSSVARALAARGYLESEKGRLNKAVRLPGRGKTRVFWVKASILDETAVMAPRVNNCGDAGAGGDIDGKLGRLNNMPRGVPVPTSGESPGATGDTPPECGLALAPPSALGESARPRKLEEDHVPGRPGVPASQEQRQMLTSQAQQAAVLLNQFGVRPTGSGVVIWKDHDNAALRGAIRLLGMESWPMRVIDPQCVPFGLPVVPLRGAGWMELWEQARAARETSAGGDSGMIAKDINTKGERN